MGSRARGNGGQDGGDAEILDGVAAGWGAEVVGPGTDLLSCEIHLGLARSMLLLLCEGAWAGGKEGWRDVGGVR